MNQYRLVILVVLVFTQIGCPFYVPFPHTSSSVEIDPRLIQVGVTTKEEIVLTFGAPTWSDDLERPKATRLYEKHRSVEREIEGKKVIEGAIYWRDKVGLERGLTDEEYKIKLKEVDRKHSERLVAIEEWGRIKKQEADEKFADNVDKSRKAQYDIKSELEPQSTWMTYKWKRVYGAFLLVLGSTGTGCLDTTDNFVCIEFDKNDVVSDLIVFDAGSCTFWK